MTNGFIDWDALRKEIKQSPLPEPHKSRALALHDAMAADDLARRRVMASLLAEGRIQISEGGDDV